MPPARPAFRPANPAAAFLADEDGTTAVEYAVMLALSLAAIFGTVSTMGGAAGGLYENSEAELKAVGFG